MHSKPWMSEQFSSNARNGRELSRSGHKWEGNIKIDLKWGVRVWTFNWIKTEPCIGFVNMAGTFMSHKV